MAENQNTELTGATAKVNVDRLVMPTLRRIHLEQLQKNYEWEREGKQLIELQNKKSEHFFVAGYNESKRDIEPMLQLLEVNADNYNLTDSQFRKFVKDVINQMRSA